MIASRLFPFLCAFAAAFAAGRTILAIGAHCGDMEITAGAVLARHARLKDRVVLLHLTLGEGGNPKMPPARYGEQKRREALAAAKAIGAEVLFAPYKDGELPDSPETVRFVAGIIRQVKPTHVITHWRASMHRDHSLTHKIVEEAVLLASLEAYQSAEPPHRGIRSILYAENWEDPEGFKPYVYIDVSDDFETWKKAVTEYEFIRGGISSFEYLDYYQSLARVRGIEARKKFAEAFDVAPESKRRVLESLP